ncbi:heavy metal-associated isoprenylated plant protein 2-like [Castanea sativa]|uniref:heavy metal-associated isoprenylated plant protein 2-like n=1 Tax=Castanea sativa TaxID=21020 RepID=UPI003F650220
MSKYLFSSFVLAYNLSSLSLSEVRTNTSDSSLLQKTVVSVELLCSKCRKRVMKLIATIEGINSIVLDPSKKTVTVIGEADPVKIIKKVRKFRKSAEVVSVGPPKEEKKDEKKDVFNTPKTCQRCDVWYVIGEDYYSYCSIM